MKTHSPPDANGGLTLIEILVILAVLAIALAMILPMQSRPDRNPLAACLNHTKQIDLAFLMYAEDNNHKFPIRTSITNGGTMEFLARNQTFPHYQRLSGFIFDFGVFVCPSDKTRQAASSYVTLTDTNLSYFLNADFPINNPSQSVLCGDRALQVNRQPINHGTLTFATNSVIAWTSELHPRRSALGFLDGHSEGPLTTDLNSIFQRQAIAAMRLSVP
jgi:type II secretory pathway pseudopilin PulG